MLNTTTFNLPDDHTLIVVDPVSSKCKKLLTLYTTKSGHEICQMLTVPEISSVYLIDLRELNNIIYGE